MNVLVRYLHQQRTHLEKLASAIVRNRESGQDVISSVLETFLTMTDAQVNASLGQTPVERFVARAVKNRSIDFLRKQKRRADADPRQIAASIHPESDPAVTVSEKLSKYPAMIPQCLANLGERYPTQAQAVGNFFGLLIDLDHKPTLDEQADRLGIESKKLKCNLCLGLKAIRKCIIDKGGSDPFKK